MAWADDMDRALKKSCYSFEDAFRWLREGKAHFVATDGLTGSVCIEGDRVVTMHMAGKFDLASARYIHDRCLEWAQARGFDKIEIEGRPGWSRFLRMKGW